MNDYVQVFAAYGHAEMYWDISFNDAQLSYVGVEDEFRRGISVDIDPATGQVSLNQGYEAGSAPDREENNLFATFKDAIVEALVSAVRKSDADYAAFLAGAAAEKDDRLRRLRDLADQIEAFD